MAGRKDFIRPSAIKNIAFADSPYTVDKEDGTILVDTSGGGVTVTLRAAPEDGSNLVIKKITTDANTLTIGRNGNTIDGSAADLTSALTSLPAFRLQYDASLGNYAIVAATGASATIPSLSGDVTSAGNAVSLAATALASSENSYIKTDTGSKDILAAAAAARRVMIVVTVTTAFADGDGAQPTLTIGEESGSATKFAAAAKFTAAAAGATFAFAGSLTSGKKLQAHLTAGTGTTETGAYTIDVIACGK